MKRRDLLGSIGGATLAGLSGCLGAIPGGQSLSEDTGVTVTDGAGRTVTVPEQVERVVAIGPGALRTVAYLEAVDRVVGVERGEHEDFRTLPYNAANPELRELPIIGNSGPDAAGDAESLLAVEPDGIFLSAIGGFGAADRIESQTGVPTVVLSMPLPLDQAGRSALYEDWRIAGTVLGQADRAEALIDAVSDRVAAIREQAPSEPTGTAYAGGISFKGSQGLTTTQVPYPPFQLAGVEHVAAEVSTDGVSVDVSPEKLLEWDPEMIFCTAQNLGLVREDLRRKPELRSLTAVEAGETYSMLPVSHYYENVGSLLVNAQFVGQQVYPDHFQDESIESIATEIYELLLGSSPLEKLREYYEVYDSVALTAGQA